MSNRTISVHRGRGFLFFNAQIADRAMKMNVATPKISKNSGLNNDIWSILKLARTFFAAAGGKVCPREIPKSRLRRSDDNFKFFFGGNYE